MSALILLRSVAAMTVSTASASYEVDLTAEARGNTDSTSSAGIDAAEEIDPFAGAKLRWDGLSFSGSYSPRIYWLEPQPEAVPSVLNRLHLELDDQLGTRGRLFLSEDFTYGLNVFSPLAGTGGLPSTTTGPPPPLASLPSLATAEVVGSTTAVGGDYALSPLLHLSATARYVVGGGADPTTQLSIPLMRSPQLDASLSYALSRGDTLTTTASALYATFTSGSVISMAQLSESWRTALNPVLQASLQAGDAVAQTRGPIGGASVSDFPIAVAGLDARAKVSDTPVLFGMAAGVAPYLDVYGAYVYERGEGTVSGAFRLEQWDFSALFRGAVLLSGFQNRGQLLTVMEVAGARKMSKDVKVQLGLRGLYEQGLTVTGSPLQLGAFINLTGVTKGGTDD
jgi:hypothetical protein